jgi:prepilin-type N-terminal cleavage/methylation domain-containing protein
MTAHRRGFTLLELTVGLAVGGIAITAGYATLTTLVDRRGRVEEVTRETSRAFAVRSSLTDWLAGAKLETRGSSASFRGVHGAHGDLPDDELTFLTSSRTPLGDGATIVRLYVARTAAGSHAGLSAEFIEWQGTRRQTVLLDSAVAGLGIRYASGVFASQGWVATWSSTTVLPGGVQVTLHAAPHDSLAALLRVPIVVPLEGGR